MANEQQLPYDGERLTVLYDFWMMRGDTRQITFDHDLGPSTAVKTAQIEMELVDSPYTTVMSATLADNSTQWDFTTSGKGIFTFIASNTSTLDPASYRYDIQLTDTSDRVYTCLAGVGTLRRDAVDNSTTSPYPAWDTLADIYADLVDLATCGDVSLLTVAATGGATATLTVANGAIFTAADNVRVVLDDGTYEDDTIAGGGVTGNVLTLTGTIAGEAAIGNVVRIL